jgi:hypothetical protein
VSILAHQISYLTQYNSQKLKTIVILQQKEALNFKLVSEIQQKKISNLFVRSQKFLQMHKLKKRGSPKIRFETISCSHLASKSQFGRHPQFKFGPARFTPHLLRNSISKQRFKTVETFDMF